jgi:hypothetical protein
MRGEMIWRSDSGRAELGSRRRRTELASRHGPTSGRPRSAADEQNLEQLKNQYKSKRKKGKRGGKGTREGTPGDARVERALQDDRLMRLAYS